VDQENQHAIADTLAVLVDEGATVVVVLHELGPLEPIVTRAVCMDAGRIGFDGPLAEAPPRLLHLGHDHDPHGGPEARHGLGLIG
jgi:zinc transport system ATP-binding protein